jgi:hypothetical protein
MFQDKVKVKAACMHLAFKAKNLHMQMQNKFNLKTEVVVTIERRKESGNHS